MADSYIINQQYRPFLANFNVQPASATTISLSPFASCWQRQTFNPAFKPGRHRRPGVTYTLAETTPEKQRSVATWMTESPICYTSLASRVVKYWDSMEKHGETKVQGRPCLRIK